MVLPGRELLSGVVEVDESYVGARRTGAGGRRAAGKAIVAIAVESYLSATTERLLPWVLAGPKEQPEHGPRRPASRLVVRVTRSLGYAEQTPEMCHVRAEGRWCWLASGGRTERLIGRIRGTSGPLGGAFVVAGH